MFGNQALRLLRSHWANPKMLAQELFAMFQANVPLEHSGPITLRASGGASPIHIRRQAGDTGPILTYNYGDTYGGIYAGDDGSLIFAAPVLDLRETDDSTQSEPGEDTSEETADEEDEPTSGGGGMPGFVVSGSGNDYTVTVYPDGLDGSGVNVSCRQLYIDASSSIPAGSAAIVAKIGDGESALYYMQVPVWGPDL